jgi:hypothetical protein
MSTMGWGRKGERGRGKMKMEWHIVCKSCG